MLPQTGSESRSGRYHLRLFVIGDFGSGDRWQRKTADAMARLAISEPPDLIIGTGDCVYANTDAAAGNESPEDILPRRFDPFYDVLGVEFYQCLGNHDLIDVFRGDPAPMIAHTRRSRVWRMPAVSYGIPDLPSWLAVHVLNTTAFGFDGHVAEKGMYSESALADELDAAARSMRASSGLKILVGHHPLFTPGKRTFKDGGDGEVRCMRRLREFIEREGVHFYLSGHEHHQSHTTGRTCEFVVQGCGGAGVRPNLNHPRRENGARLDDKVFRYTEVMNGFAVLDLYASLEVRLRFIGIPADAGADGLRVIYRCRWKGPGLIGDRGLKPCPPPAAGLA